MADALYSKYVIDGVQQEFCPAALLEDLLPCPKDVGLSVERIVDERAEADVHCFECPSADPLDLLDQLKSASCPCGFPLAFAESYTRGMLAQALIDALWRKGHFGLNNLRLRLAWRVDEGPVGAFAAFYESAAAAADYVDALGIGLASYSYEPAEGESGLSVGLEVVSEWEDKEPVSMLDEAVCPSKLVRNERSWLLYLPFDTAEYRLGGSHLARVIGLGAAAPIVEDADYFIDCYEVVREFAEDGVLLAAATVGKGGLIEAVDAMCSEAVGVEINLADLQKAAQDKSRTQLLFAEVPGVLIQIRDSDYDYVDAELLLQDVAYFPLGNPDSTGTVRLDCSAKSGIQVILNSLIQNAEGED